MNRKEKINLIGFLFCGFMLLLFVELILGKYSTTIIPQEYYCEKSIDYFEKNDSNIDIIFLGQSQSYYGINPQYVKLMNKYKAYNFSFASEPIETTYYKLLYYMQNRYLKNLKLVIIDISGNILNPSNLNTDFKYSRFYNYLDILFNHDFYMFLKAIMSYSNIVRLRPYLTDFRFTFSTTALNEFIKREHLLENGYCRRDYYLTEYVLKNDIKNYERAYKNGDYKNGYVPNPIKIKYLNRLVSIFTKKRINVIFIITPTPAIFLGQHGKYYSLVKDAERFDFYELKTEQTVKKLFPQISVFNYNNPIKSNDFTLEMFSDAGHLNFNGSKLLATKISKDLDLYFNSLLKNSRKNAH